MEELKKFIAENKVITFAAAKSRPELVREVQDKLTALGVLDPVIKGSATTPFAPETERYRIPKPFRERLPSPDSTSWAIRSQATLEVGKTGADSCSTVGAGGWTGCFMKQLKESYAEKTPEPEVP